MENAMDVVHRVVVFKESNNGLDSSNLNSKLLDHPSNMRAYRIHVYIHNMNVILRK